MNINKLIGFLIVIFYNSACSTSTDKLKVKSPGSILINKNILDSNIQMLNLEYISWGCACANWATISDVKKYQDTGKLSENCVFIEPSDSSLILPDTLGYSADIIKFTGQFYRLKGYPKRYIMGEEHPDSAKIFRYSKYEVVYSAYRNFVNDSTNNKK